MIESQRFSCVFFFLEVMTLERVVLAQGAAACRSTAIDQLLPYMTERMRARFDRLPFRPTHALIAAFPYYVGREEGNVALYARGADYVSANRTRLSQACAILRAHFPESLFYATGNGWPLPVVHGARLSGLGQIGAHGMLILPGFGSAVTLGAILTNAELSGGEDAGFCELCGLCMAACPTGAIFTRDGRRIFDRSLCLSHMTQSAELTERQRNMVAESSTVWGCDLCQLACPHNQNICSSTLPEYNKVQISRLTLSILASGGMPAWMRGDALPLRNLSLQEARDLERSQG